MSTVDFGWVNISCIISGVSGPKFAKFFVKQEGIVVDNTVFHLFSLSLPEIFAVKVEICPKSHQILDIFCPPKF